MFVVKDILKNKVTSIILITMMCLSMFGFSVVFNILLNATVKSIESREMSNSAKVINISFSKEQPKSHVEKLIEVMVEDGIKLSYIRQSTMRKPEDIYDTFVNHCVISDPEIYHYNILKGRNISLEEIRNGSKVALVSNKYIRFLEKDNNKIYINIKNEDYEVVGVIGNKYSESYYNFCVFIPYTATPKVWETDSTELFCSFTVSADSPSIDKYREEFDIGKIQESNLPVQTIQSDYYAFNNELRFLAALFLTSVVNILLFSFYWINTKKNQIGILKALGYSNKAVWMLILKELITLSFIASVITSILYYPFSYFADKYMVSYGFNSSPLIFFANCIVAFIICFIVFLVNKRNMDRVSISSNIKEHVNFSKKPLVKLVLVFQLVLVLYYSAGTFELFDYVFGTINRAKSIISVENTEIVSPFSVSFDDAVLKKYEIVKIFSDLKKEGLNIINYLYSVDSSDSVAVMQNKNKDEYNLNYSMRYFRLVKSDNVIPLLYIEKDSFNGLRMKISQSNAIVYDESCIPVYAGSSYKKYFTIGDKIVSDSGKKYQIIGFLHNNSYMFDSNESSQAVGETNKLDSFIIIPYDISKMIDLPIGYREDDFIHYSMTNSFFMYTSPEQREKIISVMDEKGIKTTPIENQLKQFTVSNYKAVSYKIFNILMILLICIGGVIGFCISGIYSEKRVTGIKIAIGYRKNEIILEYIYRILKLLFISIAIVTIWLFIVTEIKLTMELFFRMVAFAFAIQIPSIILITYMINRFKPSELIGGEQ